MEITKIPLRGLSNTRDLGGFRAADGRKILPKKLIRSGNLSRATEEDIRILTERYNVKTILDFRTEQEQAQMPDPPMKGVEHISNPILAASTMGITREGRSSEEMLSFFLQDLGKQKISVRTYMDSMYENLVSDPFSRSQYRRFFQFLLTPSEGAYLWHCTAGKDRVGVGTALLLSALGVSEKDIMEDYMMTGVFTKEELEGFLALIEQKGYPREALSFVEEMFGVRESYLAAAFSVIKKEFEGINSYLEEEMGLNQEKKTALQNIYLEK